MTAILMDLKTRTSVKLRYRIRFLLKIRASSSIPGMYIAMLFISLQLGSKKEKNKNGKKTRPKQMYRDRETFGRSSISVTRETHQENESMNSVLMSRERKVEDVFTTETEHTRREKEKERNTVLYFPHLSLLETSSLLQMLRDVRDREVNGKDVCRETSR